MLWKLSFSSFSLQTCNCLRLNNQINIKFCKGNKFIDFKKGLIRYWKQHTLKDKGPTFKKYVGITAVSLIGGLGGAKLVTGLVVADCAKGDRKIVISKKVADDEAKFDWYKFYQFLLPDVWCLLSAVACAIAAAILNVKIPVYLGNLVSVLEKFLKQNEGIDFSNELKVPVLLLIGLYVAQSVATFAYISLLSTVGERVATRMKTALFSSILRQDIAFFDKERTGELIDCLTTDVQEFKSAFKLCISQGLRSFTQIAGCIVQLYIISPVMTGLMIVIVPPIIILGTFIGSFLRKMSRIAQLQASKAINHSEEVISNIRTVRAFANEMEESETFAQEVAESCRLSENLGFGIGLFQAGANLFLNGIVLGTLYCGGYLIVSNQMTAGQLMSFLGATQTIQRSMAQLSLFSGNFIKGIQSGARVFQLINVQPSIPLSGGKIIPYHSFSPGVEFRDVTFAYPTRPDQVILKNFNLALPAGKTVAIVGSSGNGKSTVAGLLERYYDVCGGSITVGGSDIRDLDPSWLRGRAIGIINQEPVLFATTIKENIRYGKPEATDVEVYAAAKMANADEFISKFPDGYNTIVGERGITVSGGQKQRIAIARALLKNPSILILDEATSALDAESEKLVQKALDEVTRYRTVLVIAHRLSTIQNADTIVVLNNGVIVEIGNHDTLLKKKGHYWFLMNKQSGNDRSFG
ncbi:mitochondrial potassium channel ATP-binding subunit [Lycorma delicatula]|uniref:mitochondrial potassium channel ATP-binding subunit n=1 Tax=Lycorma delicatula TaxID=130591 RepID=UPI003F5170D2